MLTCISYEILKHICTCQVIYIYVQYYTIYRKQLNAIGVLDTSSNSLLFMVSFVPLRKKKEGKEWETSLNLLELSPILQCFP
jgi:hypothetical protein